MRDKKFNLGILTFPGAVIDTNTLRAIGEIKYVDCMEKRYVECLIIPHNGGLYPSVEAFGTYIPEKPMSNQLERFRVYTLESYIEKEIPIIGIGDGAALLWAHLGNKVAESRSTIICLPKNIHKGKVIDGDEISVTAFADNNMYGFSSLDYRVINLLNQLKSSVMDEISGELEDEIEV